MKITNRLYTHPVLSDEKDDYIKSKFEVVVNQHMSSVGMLALEFKIFMDNEELENLINSGKAEYMIHLECSTTSFRTTISSVVKEFKYEIPINRINGKLEMVAFIVAKKEVLDFYSSDWNDDYEDYKIKILKATILAYQNLDSLDITKDFEEFTNANSIFLVYKRQTEEVKPMNVDLNYSKIKIGLCKSDFESFSRISKIKEIQAVFHSMLILPALVYVFEELKQEGDIESYMGREWFISLRDAYLKRGISLEEEIVAGEKNSLELAQDAMELPLDKAFAQISSLYENLDEEEL